MQVRDPFPGHPAETRGAYGGTFQGVELCRQAPFPRFLFTSCGERIIEGAAGAAEGPLSVSATIINHPLNPNRAFGNEAPYSPKTPEPASEKRELQSRFVLPLFRGIMVRDKPLVKATRGRSRRRMIRHGALSCGFWLAALLSAAFFIAGYRHINGFYAETASSLSSLPPENAAIMEQYAALGVMQGVMGKAPEKRRPRSSQYGDRSLSWKRALVLAQAELFLPFAALHDCAGGQVSGIRYPFNVRKSGRAFRGGVRQALPFAESVSVTIRGGPEPPEGH